MNESRLQEWHVFRDPALRRRALTHASVGDGHNERLEFLGDALLDFLIGDMLYRRYPKHAEGALTQARARLVNDKALAALAQQNGIPQELILSAGESRGGGRQRDSILAGALEAYLAAVYLDGGMATVQKLAKQLFTETINDMESAMNDGGAMLKDAKSRLQEYLQKHKKPLPEYEVVARDTIGKRVCVVAICRTDGNRSAMAVADNQQDAEQAAGGCMLAMLVSLKAKA